MYLLTLESRKALEHQLLKVGNLYDRWIDFQRELMESEEINHLWSNKHFRDAYYSVTQITESIEDLWSEPGNLDERSGFINKIVGEIEEDDVEMFEQLLEAAKLIAKDKEGDSEEYEHYKNLINDLAAFKIISVCYAECQTIREKYGVELVSFLDRSAITKDLSLT